MRARYYEPGTGRFISEDPAMHGENWYAYCGGDPIQKVDPSGRIPMIALAGLWGAAQQGYALLMAGADTRTILVGMLTGAVGAMISGALGKLSPTISVALGEAVDTALNQLLLTGTFDFRKIMIAAGIGAAGGGILEVIVKTNMRQKLLKDLIDDVDDNLDRIAIGIDSIVSTTETNLNQ